MMKTTITLYLLLLIPALAFAQTRGIATYHAVELTGTTYKQELNQVFSAYEIFELNTEAIVSNVRSAGYYPEFTLNLGEHSWEFKLEKYDIRSDDYKFVWLTPEGRKEFGKGSTITYKGIANGNPNNIVRATITEEYVSFAIMDGGQVINIDPAKNHVEGGRVDHYVVFSANAYIDAFKCGTVTPVGELDIQISENPEDQLSASACAQADVAIAATSDLVNAKGGTKASAETFLTDFFNKAELYYENIDYKHVLRGMVVSTSTSTNMTNSNTVQGIRDDFANWAISGNGFAGITHDIGSIIVSKGGIGGVSGQANFQGLCAQYASWHYMFSDIVVGAHTLAHEWAHMWGSPHDNSNLQGYETPNSCPNNNCIMVGVNGHLAPVGSWSAKTLQYMEAYKNGPAASCTESCVAIAPTASFTTNATTGCGSLTVKFTDKSKNSPTSWLWDFGDGSTSTAQNPEHTYSPGKYTVKLTATNEQGNNTYTETDLITVEAGSPAQSQYVGMKNIDTDPSKGGYKQEYDYWQGFDALQELTIVSFKVNAEVTGRYVFGIALPEATETFIDTRVDLTPGEHRISLNWTVKPGTYRVYFLADGGTNTGHIWRQTSGAQYPYELTGLISINDNYWKHSSGYNGTDGWYIGYDWEVRKAGCDTGVGIEENEGMGIQLMPNPGTGLYTLNLNTTSGDPVIVEVYNFLGQQVYSENMAASSKTVDITDQPSGTYFLVVKDGQIEMKKKFLKF